MAFYSKDYRDQLKKMHRKKWGHRGFKWHQDVRDFAKKLDAKSILDYGCGKGSLGRVLKDDYAVQDYDPGLECFASPPRPADLVTCTDVMEHVEMTYIHEVIRHIYSLANKGAYLVISLVETNDILPDGRQAHISLYPPEVWLDMFNQLKWDITHENTGEHLKLWCVKSLMEQ